VRLDGKLAAIGAKNGLHDVIFGEKVMLSRVFQALENWHISLSAVWKREM
jgi:hypothetical protein